MQEDTEATLGQQPRGGFSGCKKEGCGWAATSGERPQEKLWEHFQGCTPCRHLTTMNSIGARFGTTPHYLQGTDDSLHEIAPPLREEHLRRRVLTARDRGDEDAIKT